MKVLFIGTVEFSLKILEKLISIDIEISGVCTKERSDFNSDYADLIPLCIKNDIPYKYIIDINSQNTIKWIKLCSPDIIFCFGWSSLIKNELLKVAPMGIIGFHPTQLPCNRGRHPLIWAIVLGLKSSASTFFFMEEGVDSGDILSQVKFDISYEDDASSLYQKVIYIALKQIEEFIPKLKYKNYERIKQNHSLSNIWRKRSQIDGIIDFKMSSYAIYNLVRGLSKPYVGASVVYKDSYVKVWKIEEVKIDISNIEFGKVLEVQNNTILIKTYDNAIRIVEHEFETLPKIGEYL